MSYIVLRDRWCSLFLDQRKHATMQWLQNLNERNVNNVNNIRHEARRHFRNKKKEYQKSKIEELETNSKNRNVRDL